MSEKKLRKYNVQLNYNEVRRAESRLIGHVASNKPAHARRGAGPIIIRILQMVIIFGEKEHFWGKSIIFSRKSTIFRLFFPCR